jgi:hypothetical protein
VASLKRKGDLAELKVAADLAAQSDGRIVLVRCFSHSLTNGKIRATKRYTRQTVDWIATYDSTTERCYYLPSGELGDGRATLTLRLQPARNGQLIGTRDAADYTDPDLSVDPLMEPAGIEPATSCLQSKRSAN